MRSMRFRVRVLRLLPAGGVLGLTLLGLTLLAQSLIPLALSLATGDLVGRLPAAIGSSPGSSAFRSAALSLGVLVALFLASRVMGPIGLIAHTYVTRRIDAAVQGRVMRAASTPVGLGHLEDPEVLDDLEHVGEPVGAVAVSVPNLMAASVTAVGAVLIVGRVDWRIGALLFVLVLAQRTFWRDFFLRMSDVRAGMHRDLRRANYLADLILQPAAAKETRIFGLTGWLTDAYRTSWKRAVAPMWNLDDGNLRTLLKVLPLRAVSFGIPYVALVMQVTSGRISLSAFIAALQATGVAIGTARFREEDVYLEQLAAPVNALYSVESLPRDSHAPGVLSPPPGDLTFSDIRFSYPSSSVAVYDGLSLTIPAGISTAIVGANGAGKTTLIRLLARLYEPTEGRICVGGVDVRDLDPEAWRSQLAIIFQDFVRYQLSASDNITFGAPSLKAIEPSRSQAAIKAGAFDLLTALPEGWETTLSRRFEGGVDLSGGEWQRVALARALYAVEAGARILVLDEPTANLDVRAEAALYDDFMEITRGLTTILISHRFSTVRRAQHICVIDEGRLIEEGSHEELVSIGGIYARMFSIQAARFL